MNNKINWRKHHLISRPVCGTETNNEELKQEQEFWHSPYLLYEACISCKRWRRIKWGILIIALLTAVSLGGLETCTKLDFYWSYAVYLSYIGLLFAMLGSVFLASGFLEKLFFANIGFAGDFETEQEGKNFYCTQRKHFFFMNGGAVFFVLGSLLQVISLILSR